MPSPGVSLRIHPDGAAEVRAETEAADFVIYMPTMRDDENGCNNRAFSKFRQQAVIIDINESRPEPLRRGRAALQVGAGDLCKSPGAGASSAATTLETYAVPLRETARADGAGRLEARAKAIRAMSE